MEKISSIEQYLLLNNTVKAACHRSVFSNNYASTSKIGELIGADRLFFQQIDSGIAFLTDCGTKYYLRLCCSPSAMIRIETLDKPIICEIVYNAYTSTSQEAIEDRLMADGFSLEQILHEYHIQKPDSVKMEEFQKMIMQLQSEGYRFDTLQSKNSIEAYQLLSDSIHRNDLIGYPYFNWDRIIERKLAAVAFSPEGELCAVCVLPEAYSGGLTAVSKAYRGKGLGKAIEVFSYFFAAPRNAKLSIWISDDNHVNQHVMTWMGATITDRAAHQFAKR